MQDTHQQSDTPNKPTRTNKGIGVQDAESKALLGVIFFESTNKGQACPSVVGVIRAGLKLYLKQLREGGTNTNNIDTESKAQSVGDES